MNEEEQRLINQVFEFSDTTVREAMIPRTEIVGIPATATLEEIAKVVADTYPTMDIQWKIGALAIVYNEGDPIALEAAALAEPRIVELLAGATPRKVVVVPGKMVSIVP